MKRVDKVRAVRTNRRACKHARSRFLNRALRLEDTVRKLRRRKFISAAVTREQLPPAVKQRKQSVPLEVPTEQVTDSQVHPAAGVAIHISGRFAP